MTGDNVVTGRCFCGAVRFRFGGQPIATRACWCRDCQYLSSGNASLNAIFATDIFELAGDTAEYVSAADSGTMIRRRFCPICGTPLFCDALGEPDVMVVRCGALDDPGIGRPASVIWASSAPEWARHQPKSVVASGASWNGAGGR